MTARNIPCWKIINCRPSECCLSQYAGKKECWEVATELDDYRSVMNICEDCIVYVSKQEESVLSLEELTAIMQKKGCVLTQKCPNFQPRPS